MPKFAAFNNSIVEHTSWTLTDSRELSPALVNIHQLS